MQKNKTINVAIFTEGLAFGGISSYCLELASALRGMPGIDVCLAGINDNRWSWLIDQARERGLELVQIQSSGRYDWSAVRRIHNFLVEKRIDVAHTQGYRLNIMLRASRLVYHSPVKLVNTLHGIHAFRTANFTGRSYYLLDYATLFLSDAIIAVSAATLQKLIAWHVPKVGKAIVIPNGVRVPHPANPAELVRKRAELGLDACENTVGFVGRLAKEKGVGLLTKVIRGMIQKNPKYQFLIVGDGPQRHLVQELVAEFPKKVIHVGAQQNVHQFLELIGVLLLTSETEGMPMVVLEAFSHGVPVVATNVGGVPEVVTDGVTGFLHSPEDMEGLINSAIRLMYDGALRRGMANNCLTQCSTRFSCTQMAERTHEIYCRVAGVATTN